MNLQNLKKELPYKWRIQSVNEHGAVCVAYIDSRDVQDLLDEVVGAENWQSDYKEVKGNVYAGVAILINGVWVWKWDCGVESKTDAEKGEASDSFKRAAVKWGIGRFLYSIPINRLKTVQNKNKYYPVNSLGDIIWNGEELTNYLNRPILSVEDERFQRIKDKLKAKEISIEKIESVYRLSKEVKAKLLA